jgi:hypothetical protein
MRITRSTCFALALLAPAPNSLAAQSSSTAPPAQQVPASPDDDAAVRSAARKHRFARHVCPPRGYTQVDLRQKRRRASARLILGPLQLEFTACVGTV